MDIKRQAFSSSTSNCSRLSSSYRRQSKRKLVRLQRQRCINDDPPSAETRPTNDGEYWIGVAPLLDMTGTARVLACKAANISSAMLAHRRKSSAITALGATLPTFTALHKKSSGASSMTSPKWQQQELFHTVTTPSAPAVSSAAANRRQTARESVAVLAENWNVFTMDPTAASIKDEMTDDLLCCMGLFEFSLKLACLASMISVCLHTPHTTNQWPSLHYWLLTTDIFCTAIFSLDALLKINSRASLRDRWCQFDLILLLFHYGSICVHCAELINLAWPRMGIQYQGWWGTVRSPRPFIMIKFIRSVIRFKLPRNRIQLIMKRSSQQIQNVTIFFLFFMTLYAIMGVQLFGRMEYHCVLPGTDPNNVTIADLAIPDTMCSPDGHGYECPPTMECMKLSLRANQIGFYGMFNDFASSLFTVYMAASQEGWVFVFYDTLDTFPSYFGFFYFITLIFFLAWLVKNVFIAVITETFAEIRVQFSEMWQSREVPQHEEANQTKLERDDEGEWQLREFDPKLKDFDLVERAGRLRRWLRIVIRSTTFQTCMLCLVVVNALVNASFVYRHNKSDIRRKRLYYWVEVFFTAIFCLESLVKMLGLGWPVFWRRGQHRFELVLCIGSAMNVVPALYLTNYFTYFQVFRLLRLVKISPMLEDFVYKIFGPGKKLGGLILFTLSLVVITSAISLQLFCFVPNLDKFRTFPQAFMSMFQIITQEGWTDVVVEILRSTNEHWVPFVAIYFVGYHLFVTLIVLSLFVAVILDNLEMDEELKKIKQLKAREETTTMRTQLPWRLRIFEKFPTRPQMIELRKISREFPLPKVRDSFTRQFFDCIGTGHLRAMAAAEIRKEEIGGGKTPMTTGGIGPSKKEKQQPEEANNKTAATKTTTMSNMMGQGRRTGGPALLFNAKQVQTRMIGQFTSKKTVGQLLDESNKQRSLLSDSSQQVGGVSAWIRGAIGGVARRRREQNTFRHHQAQRQTVAAEGHLKENGDIRTASETAAKETSGLKTGGLETIDIKALQRKRAQAEFTRNRIEEEMRENHPFFDSPLFFVGRNSALRLWCLQIVEAKYNSGMNDEGGGMNGSFRGANPTTAATMMGGGMNSNGRRPLATHRYKQFHAFLGLLTYLDWTMVLVTAFSCAAMLFESPWPITGENMVFRNSALKTCDLIFVLAMTLELGLKIIAHGLFFTPNAVVRDVGGFMTLFIYASSFWYLAWMPEHVEENSWAQLLMICRAMRPLRIYTLVPHIRRVVVELCKGFREILLVTILLVLFMFMFASFGLQIVGGKLAACNDVTITSKKNCTGLFEQKLFVTRMEVYGKNDEDLHPKMLVPRVWTNPRNFNFDHIGNAMLALFETLSYKGWNVIRDIFWARQGPWAVLFIHIYVFIGCMIGLTLFVDVVIANYMENRGTALLTVDQRRWHDLKARLRMAQPLHVPPRPAESARIRNRLYELSMHRYFKQFYAILVVLNSATLAIPWSVEEEERRPTLLFCFTLFSAFCICLFTLEILLKSIAFTPLGFWQSRRSRIDLLITWLGLCWIVAHFGVIEVALPIVSVPPREFRRFSYSFGYIVGILRFFTIAGRKSTLKMLMLTVVWSMVRSAFIIAAMFLLVLFYAYTGVILFGTVRYGQALSKHVNFRSGKHALMVLFRSITGEDWNDIMHDCMRSDPHCYWGPGLSYWQTDCGNYMAAIVYFCSFYLIITYIVLNLLVAVIMENFSLFYSSEEDALLSYADIRNYQQVWNMVDLEQKHAIPVRRVKFLLRLLKGRLEVDPNRDRLLFKHMCHEMQRLNNGEDVSFHDILSMLSYRSVDIRKSLQLEELVQREELEYLIEEEVAKQTIRSWLEACLRRIKQQQRQREGTQGSNIDLVAQIRAMAGNAYGQSSPSSPNQKQEKKKERSESTGTKLSSSGGKGQQQRGSETPTPSSPTLLVPESGIKVDKRRRRSSSIPELVEEAKRFVWGGRLKSLPRTSIGRRAGATAMPIREETGGGSNGTTGSGSSPIQQRPDRPAISIVSELMAATANATGGLKQQKEKDEVLKKRQSVTIRRNHAEEKQLEQLSPTSPTSYSGPQQQQPQRRLSPTVIAIQREEAAEEEERRRSSLGMSAAAGKCPNLTTKGSVRSKLLGLQQQYPQQQQQQQQSQIPASVETVLDWWANEC